MSPQDLSRTDPRLAVAVLAARAVGAASRRFKAGGGTSAGGVVAQRIDPRVLEKLSRRPGVRVVVVSGTNGKTTTARLLADMLVQSGERVVHNRAGANLLPGIVSTLATHAAGSVHAPVTAVLEVDEAVLPDVLARTDPSMVVLTNVFRDQLDRYGEVDATLTRWRTAVRELPAATTLVVNADDPSLVDTTEGVAAHRMLYGIEDSIYRLEQLPHSAEVVCCPTCRIPYTYDRISLGHLGEWHCATCSRSRPHLDIAASCVELWSSAYQSLKIGVHGSVSHFEVGLPGLYNTYNLLAAVTAAEALGVADVDARIAASHHRGVFGRAELISHSGRWLTLMLVKNPAGFDEVLRTLRAFDRSQQAPLLLCLNDGAADGRDVSWIWDVDFESVAETGNECYCAGTRWADLANRLHYAGVDSERLHGLGIDPTPAFDAFARRLPPGGSGFVLATYSAMLQLRRELSRRDDLVEFWEQ